MPVLSLVNLQVGIQLPKGRRRCDNAWMTGLSLALANLKPGTGKTTSAVWLAHVFTQAGNSVLLVDADPSGSALEWSDLAAMDPHLTAPEALQDLGYHVLATVVPRREVYAQSFGLPIKQNGLEIWRQVARELIDRCAPLCSVRS